MTAVPEDGRRERIVYAFGHLVSGQERETAHSADSMDLARDVLDELGLTAGELDLVELLAEEVAGNYRYTGKADEVLRRIRSGEL